MKKKFIRSAAAILVLILALSFVFSGCSGKKEGEDGTTEMPSDAVEAIQTLKLPYSKADKLNPFTATSMLNQQLMTLIYDGCSHSIKIIIQSRFSRRITAGAGAPSPYPSPPRNSRTARVFRPRMLWPRLRAQKSRPHIKRGLRISAVPRSAETALFSRSATMTRMQ